MTPSLSMPHIGKGIAPVAIRERGQNAGISEKNVGDPSDFGENVKNHFYKRETPLGKLWC